MRAIAIPLLLFIAAPAARAQMAQDSAAQADSLRIYGQMIVQTADSIFLPGADSDSARAVNRERFTVLRATRAPSALTRAHRSIVLLAQDRVYPQRHVKLPGPSDVGGGGAQGHCYMELAPGEPITHANQPNSMAPTGSSMACHSVPVPGTSTATAPRPRAGHVTSAGGRWDSYLSERRVVADRLAAMGLTLPPPPRETAD